MGFISKTQKGKGVLALMQLYIAPPLRGFATTPEECEKYMQMYDTLFARPCPQRPRHGFVDSRIVHNVDELKQVLIETLAADPGGEVMLMDPIDSPKWSAVWTPNMVTFGKGNDGATAGVDTISIPLSGKMSINKELLKDALIGDDEDPYVELVKASQNSGGTLFITQLRAGPKLGKMNGPNYLPADITVKEIVFTQDDDNVPLSLLAWEKLMQEKAQDKEGVVIVHPGGSMTDHFTVHARTFGIPVLLDGTVPAIGDTLEKQTDEIPLDPASVLRGIVAGEQVGIGVKLNGGDKHSTHAQVALLLTALYNAPSMGGDYGRWLGIATALMLRFGSAALSGEARHVVKQNNLPMKQREVVYNTVFPYTLTRHHARTNRLTNVLRYGFEGGGIGGEKWAKCGAALMPLFNAVGLLAREPTVENVNNIIRTLNVAVDQAHNNGWWLNKFTIGTDIYAGIQNGAIDHVCKMGDAIFDAEKAFDKLTIKLVNKRVGEWAGWKALEFRPLQVRTANMIAIPGFPGMTLKLRSRFLGKIEKEINIPSKVLSDKLMPLLGSMYIVPSANGLAVEIRKGKESIRLWEEEALL
jgi:hypothetical protein